MILANCDKARAFSVYDRCKVKFELPKDGRLINITWISRPDV
jgi:hypothetical protein